MDVHKTYDVIAEWFSRNRSQSLMERIYLDKMIAILEPENYRLLLQANLFQVVEYVEDDATCGGATVWPAQHAKENNTFALRQFFAM